MVTGGAGYKGSVLVPKLLSAGHDVTVVDTMWFGDHLPHHRALRIKKQDIREGVDCANTDAIIHLAGIANDPCGELDAKLTWEVNVLSHMQLCDAAARAGVSQFIYASSASVYGIKDDEPINENATLEPVSDYNKTKMCAERVLLSYSDAMTVQIVRPATVCGMSPRMRLDTMVNMLTVQALKNGKITAHCGEHGGNLMRPNTHIEDITNLYCWLLKRPHLMGVWNAGFENLSASATASLIAEVVPAEIELTRVKDKRSYAVDSSRLRKLGFKPKYTVRDAIEEIAASWAAGELKDGDDKMNLAWMQSHGRVRG
jgi:nucleoside-diphosphate-sugar epimerase